MISHIITGCKWFNFVKLFFCELCQLHVYQKKYTVCSVQQRVHNNKSSLYWYCLILGICLAINSMNLIFYKFIRLTNHVAANKRKVFIALADWTIRVCNYLPQHFIVSCYLQQPTRLLQAFDSLLCWDWREYCQMSC